MPVEDKSKPVVAKMGQSLYFVADDSYYNIDYLRINGEDCPYGNYNGTIYGDVTIDVKQTLKPAWSAEVTVDVPERIEYNEHYSRPNIIPETSPFTVSIPEDMASYNYLVFKTSNSDYAIVSLTLDGEEIEKNSYTGEYQVYLKKDGQKINITTKEIERDKLFSFYFDSPEKANDTFVELYGFSLSCAEPSRKFEDIHAGYNVINFDEVDNAFKFYVYGPIETAVVPQVHAYLNNEPNYIVDNSHWQNNFNDGDVFKVYICPEAPATSTVEFTVQGEGAVEAATVDLINEFEVVDGLKMENILPGTEFPIALNPDFTITVNGDELEDPQNYYKFTVSEDTKVVISSTTGIETVVVESGNNAVYNLLGVQVGESATNGLPAGLYIQNGKKLLVK